jgi:hypothetical protein
VGYRYKILLFLLFLFLYQEYNSADGTNEIDIENYCFEINHKAIERKDILDVEVTILLKKNHRVSQIDLLFSSDSRISSVKCKDKEEWINLEYEFSAGDSLKLYLPSILSQSDKATLLFEYHYPVNDTIENILYLDRGFRWYPLIIDDIALFEMTANVANEFEVFSAGNLTEVCPNDKFATYKWESKIPVFKIPFILIRDSVYNKFSKRIKENDILFYLIDKDLITSEKIINEAGNLFQFCDSLIGTYHHNQLTFIEMPEVSGSMIGTGIVIVGSDFIKHYRQDYFNGLHLSIAAQWFGCSVFGKFRDKGFWFFSLSLPHYLRLMYIENSRGKEVFEKELAEPYKKYLTIAGGEKDFPILSIHMIDTKEKGLTIYGKGPYLIDILRKNMNDQKWVFFLQGLYNKKKGKILTYESFKNFLLELDNDYKLEQKFDEMMRTKGFLKTTEI